MALMALGVLCAARPAVADGTASDGKLLKVLPLLLNLQGHDATSPSLFDRDAYQFYLVQHTNEVSSMRYDIEWKASRSAVTNVTVRMELRGVAPNGDPRLKTLEATATPGRFRKWTTLALTPEEYKQLGSVVAWHATLWAGDKLLSEQKSFLW